MLADDGPQAERELCPNLPLDVLRIKIGKPRDRPLGVARVQGGEDEMPRFGGINAICPVAASRISPTRITSGSCRRPYFSPSAKELTSRPTSRCVTIELPWVGLVGTANKYSIGSSTVMIR